MNQYAYVEDGQIVETHVDLPHCWRHISGLDLSKDDNEYLNSQGWYKIVPTTVEYDAVTHEIVSYNYSFADGTATSVPVIQEKETEVTFSDEYYLSSIRQMRDEALSKSDWTQTVDVIESHSTEWNTAWKEYRQKLRDLPTLYNEVGDFSKLSEQWPSKPTITE